MTGQDILQAEFEKVGMRGGYKADQVDEFLSNIAKFVDSQENDKSELEYKIKILAEKIEQYKREEDNMKEALIGAQTHGKRVVEEAKAKAEDMIKQTELACEKSLTEAKKKSDLLTENSLNKAKNELTEIQRECFREREILERLKIETSKFRKSILDQYKSHIAAVQNLPSLVDQSLGNKVNAPVPPSPPENKAKQIMREEENKVAKEPRTEPRTKSERPERPDRAERPERVPNEQRVSRHTQVQKNKLADDNLLSEESKLEKSKTLEFDGGNMDITAIGQPLQQQIQQNQPPKQNKPKQDLEQNKNNNTLVQTEQRPDYLKKFGELDFGKNKGK